MCLAFLLHLRSALVAVVSLPLGVLAAFVVMRLQGVNANIMSLGGIAIAIGAMVDAAIVMIENAHKKLEGWKHEHGGEPDGRERWRIITEASVEVGPALFFSLLIITLSFVPVFTLEAQEGRLFAPLAFTKTYAMAAAAGLSVTLVPVLMGYFDSRPHSGRGRESAESRVDRRLPPAAAAPRSTWPKATLVARRARAGGNRMAGAAARRRIHAAARRGRPALHADGAAWAFRRPRRAELLQQTDRLISTVPEVARVFGKIGRAETATDPGADGDDRDNHPVQAARRSGGRA